MCNVGGGTNRCLAHNPISKFVVKVVTVRTKADETLVNKTLGELSKEGKNLPSPAPEVVKSWVETEKFAAQYDPELSEHDRKIQLNRLDRAETENVNGGHFHAWKNLHNAVRSKLAKKLAAGGLVVGMSFSLVGCIANGNNDHPVTPLNPPISTSAPASPSAASYGGVIGSGQQVKAADGTYETVIIDKDSPVYKYNNGQGNTPEMEAAGYSAEDGQASQKFVADYMVNEFVDSKALETKDQGYDEWYATSAKNYFTPNVYQELGANRGKGQVILGDLGSMNTMPNLIHDGKPREKSLNLNVMGFAPYSDGQGNKGIKYAVEYTAEYRVSDAEAAKFAGQHVNMTPEQFLQSDLAKPSVKDGKGENSYQAKGTANIVVTKDEQGAWKIIGFSSQTNFDVTDFVNQ